MLDTFRGILIPFLGTVLGAACVLFLQKNLNRTVQRILTGFAAGVMTAASVWSLPNDIPGAFKLLNGFADSVYLLPVDKG